MYMEYREKPVGDEIVLKYGLFSAEIINKEMRKM